MGQSKEKKKTRKFIFQKPLQDLFFLWDLRVLILKDQSTCGASLIRREKKNLFLLKLIAEKTFTG